MNFKQCLLSAVLTLCLAGVCNAIECYECQSTVDPQHCGEKFSESSQIRKVDCKTKQKPAFFAFAPEPTQCSKLVAEDSNGKVVIRGCHYQNPGTSLGCTIDTAQLTAKTLECKSCSGNLCNGASRQYAALGTVLLVLTSAIFML